MNKAYQKLMKERPESFQNTTMKGSIFLYTDPEKIAEIEQRFRTEIGVLYQDQYIYLVKDAVRHPNGEDGTYIRILYMARDVGVVILPILQKEDTTKVLLTSHYRHASRKTYLELPRGFSERGLSEAENVQKELFEETGYQIKRMEYMGNLAADTGMIGGEAKAYAVYLEGTPGIRDQKESIREIQMVGIERLEDMIRDGEIIDGYTLSAVALGHAIGLI